MNDQIVSGGRVVRYLYAVLLGTACCLSGCAGGPYANRGTAVGGIGGAIAGAALGDHKGNAGPAAVLGGIAGALAGNAVGNSMDAEVAHASGSYGRFAASNATGVQDVLAMSQAGVQPDVIVTHIRNKGVVRPPTSSEIIQMTQAGVHQSVIQAMQQAPGPVPLVTPVQEVVAIPVGPPPIVVHGSFGPRHYPHFRRCR